MLLSFFVNSIVEGSLEFILDKLEVLLVNLILILFLLLFMSLMFVLLIIMIFF